MAQFKYEPIDLEGPAFRLVQLLKGNNDDIQCELFQAWLHQSEGVISYEAFSYTWGSVEKTDNIKVNGRIMGVTQNLYLALRHLRFEDKDRILWIDAICIDQDNIKERGHQVQQMAEIYNKAERVIIWLGTATYETKVVMDSMKQLQEESINYACNDWKVSDQRWVNIWLAVQPKLRSVHTNLMARQREGLESLLGQSWFKRVWILQEVANAQAAVVVCGTKSVSARIFALIPFLLGLKPDPHCQAVLDILPGYSRKDSWWCQKRDLHTLLVKFSKSEATDPRDIIYALLGMSSDAYDTDLLRADYTKSVQDVIQDATSFLLSLHELHHTKYDLPAWTLPQFLQNVDSLSSVVLNWALERGYGAMVELLLKREDVDVSSIDKDGKTLLLRIAERGSEEMMKLLLKQEDVDVNSKDKDGRTPLSWAAERGNEEMVKLLLKQEDVDVNSKDKDGRTPLSWAAERGDEGGRTWFPWAAERGNVEVVELLLKREDVDVNSKDKDGRTPLSWAAERGDKDGRTPFSWTAERGNVEVVELLLKREDVDVNSEDKDGKTPLSWARGNEVMRLLVKAERRRRELEVEAERRRHELENGSIIMLAIGYCILKCRSKIKTR